VFVPEKPPRQSGRASVQTFPHSKPVDPYRIKHSTKAREGSLLPRPFCFVFSRESHCGPHREQTLRFNIRRAAPSDARGGGDLPKTATAGSYERLLTFCSARRPATTYFPESNAYASNPPAGSQLAPAACPPGRTHPPRPAPHLPAPFCLGLQSRAPVCRCCEDPFVFRSFFFKPARRRPHFPAGDRYLTHSNARNGFRAPR